MNIAAEMISFSVDCYFWKSVKLKNKLKTFQPTESTKALKICNIKLQQLKIFFFCCFLHRFGSKGSTDFIE
jgi:hypothetical protein